MKSESRKFQTIRSALALSAVLVVAPVRAHIVPPEQFHPVVESYRRMMFLLNLNPVLWETEVIEKMAQLAEVRF